MAGVRVASFLVLAALLLNLTLAGALAEPNQDFDVTSLTPLTGGEVFSPSQSNDLDNDEMNTPDVFELCTESGSSCFDANAFDEDSKAQFNDAAAAFNDVDYEATGTDMKNAEATESMVPARFTTFATATASIPLAPSTLATFGLSGATISGWTPPPTVLGTSTQINKRDTTTSTALPCVTTLATYGLPGVSLSNWAPPEASCPTTLVTAITSKSK